MTATTEQLLDMHDRTQRVIEDLQKISEGAKLYGLPFVNLKIHASQVDDWRKNHMLKAIGEALLRERNETASA